RGEVPEAHARSRSAARASPTATRSTVRAGSATGRAALSPRRRCAPSGSRGGGREPASGRRGGALVELDVSRSYRGGMGAGTVTLFLCGDVMLGRGVDQILPHPGDPALREEYIRDGRDYVGLVEAASRTVPRPVPTAWPRRHA